MTSTATPRSASPVAAARPGDAGADDDDSRPRRQRLGVGRPVRRRGSCGVRSVIEGAFPRKVCAMLRCQPGIVSLRTAVKPLLAHPLPESRCTVERTRCATGAGTASRRRVRNRPHGMMMRRAHRVPDRGGDPRITHRVVVHRQRRARAQQGAQRPQLGVGVGEVADQVGGQDAVERTDDAGFPRGPRAAVHETDRGGPRFGLRLVEHAARRVDGDDLGLRRDAQQRSRRCAGAASGVEQPQPAPASGSCKRWAESRRWAWYPGLESTSRS